MNTRILIVSPEAVGSRMSGPAIRYWHIAQALAAEHSVTLAVPGDAVRTDSAFRCAPYDPTTGAELRHVLPQADVLLCGGLSLYRYHFLRDSSLPLVVDLYDPFLFETLEIHSTLALSEQFAQYRSNASILTELLQRGDFFICASETQRDFWLGMLAAGGRINPATFQADRTLRRLIDLVPFGVPELPPRAMAGSIKGRYPGIAAGDDLIYWGGGLWEWFDPLTAIRAMALVRDQRPTARLLFAGLHHPNPDVPQMRMAAEAQRLSDELGLTGKTVFFNNWVPYDERAAYLLDADLGLSLHFEHMETRYSFRTRLLDSIWAGLPMVLSEGDTVGALMVARGLAVTVASQDVSAVAAAILAWLRRPDARVEISPQAQALATELRWSRIIAPLAVYCRAPTRAADHDPVSRPALKPTLLSKGWESLRARGPRGLWRDVRAYLNLR